MRITIRKVMPEEADEYVVCHADCWNAAYKGIVPDEYLDGLYLEERAKERAERYRKAWSETVEMYYYCVEHERKMIGILTFGKSSDADKPAAGDLVAIYLTEPFWGKGYGGKMMDFTLAELKTLGYDEVLVWVFEDNYKAQRFYEKYGFICDGSKRELTCGKPLAAIRYTLHFR